MNHGMNLQFRTSSLQILPNWSADRRAFWRVAPMKSASVVGGQGVLNCNKNICSCFKAGRKCNSRCHKGSTKCTNNDDQRLYHERDPQLWAAYQSPRSPSADRHVHETASAQNRVSRA